MFKSDLGIVRGDAVVVMLRILSEPTKGFGHRATHQAKADVQRALHDPSVIVRMDIVSALGTFGAHDMIAALRHVAEADPGPEVQGHSVRKSALEAIAKIEQRSRKSAK
jgi:HEAT repeat protein